jgi:hypothetical protein
MQKNIFKKIIFFMFAFILLLPFTSSYTYAETSVSVSPSTLTLSEGGSQELFASTNPWSSDAAFTWDSSDSSIVSVDQNGIITAKKTGTATITATLTTDPNSKGSSTITVEPASTSPITVHLRVEGYDKSIIDDTPVTIDSTQVTDNNGKTQDYGMYTPYGVLIKELNQLKIPFIIKYLSATPYVSSINNETEKHFGLYDGWLYTVIRNGAIDPQASQVGMSQLPLHDGDTVIIYYGDYGIPTAQLSVDKQTANLGDTITATVKSLNDQSPLADTTVHFGNDTATTDHNGQASYTIQSSGDLSIYAEKKDSDGKPTIVRTDKEILNIAGTISLQQIKQASDKTIAYYQLQGAPSSDWAVFGLNTFGEQVNKAPYINSDGNTFINELPAIDSNSMTDWERRIIALRAGGYDPTSFNGTNYIDHLLNLKSGLNEGINAAIFGLIAMDAASAQDIAGANYSRQSFIDYILAHKAGDGWNLDLTSSQPDPDVTAMALYALAPHQDQAAVKGSIGPAVTVLKAMQNDDGGFGTNSQSTAQVIQALTALAIDPQGTSFMKANGNNPVTALLQYQMTYGQFHNIMTDSGNSMATEQGLAALASLHAYYQNGISTIYQNVQPSSNEQTPATRAFTIDSGSLVTTNGLKASATINPMNGGHPGSEVVVFQLMKDNTPDNIVAVEKDITASEKVSAYFNRAGQGYSVKVYVVDSFEDSPSTMGNNLADSVTIH